MCWTETELRRNKRRLRDSVRNTEINIISVRESRMGFGGLEELTGTQLGAYMRVTSVTRQDETVRLESMSANFIRWIENYVG